VNSVFYGNKNTMAIMVIFIVDYCGSSTPTALYLLGTRLGHKPHPRVVEAVLVVVRARLHHLLPHSLL